MIRNLKVFGLALVAVFAMSALVASAASANKAYWFNSDTGAADWTKLSGEQIKGTPDTFVVDAGTVSCTTATYAGSTSATTTNTITLAPTYAGCTLFPLPGTAAITTNGCSYDFQADGQTTNGDGTVNGKFDTNTTVVCPTTTTPTHVTHDITVVVTLAGVTKCTVHIEEQSLGTGVTLTNETNGSGVKDLKAHISFSNVKYTQTAGTGEGKCATTTTTSNGVYTGGATIEGKNTGNTATSIWVES